MGSDRHFMFTNRIQFHRVERGSGVPSVLILVGVPDKHLILNDISRGANQLVNVRFSIPYDPGLEMESGLIIRDADFFKNFFVRIRRRRTRQGAHGRDNELDWLLYCRHVLPH